MGILAEILKREIDHRDEVTAEELADKAGVPRSSVSRFLNGERGLSIENVEKLLDHFGLLSDLANLAERKLNSKRKLANPAQKKPKRRDNARNVAKASGGALDAAQVRILRALRDFKYDITTGNELSRVALKRTLGIGKESTKWIASLRKLAANRPQFVLINEYEGKVGRHYVSITRAGRNELKKAEAKAISR